MANKKVGIDIIIDAEQAQTELGSVGNRVSEVETKIRGIGNSGTQALSNLQDSARNTANATRNLGSTVQKAGGRFGDIAGAIGDIGAVVGVVNPKLGAMGDFVGSVGTAVVGAAGAMGPWGIAIAGIATVITAAIPWLQQLRDEHNQTAEAAAQSTEDHRDLLDIMRQFQNQALIEAGLASSETYQEIVENSHVLVAALERELSGTMGRIQQAVRDVNRLQQSNASVEDIDAADARLRALQRNAASLRTGIASAREQYQKFLRFQTQAVERELAEGAADFQAELDEDREEALARRREERIRAAENDARRFEALLAGLGGNQNLSAGSDDADAAQARRLEKDQEIAEAIAEKTANAADIIRSKEEELIQTQRDLMDAFREAGRSFEDSWTRGVDAVIEDFERLNEAAEKSGNTQISVHEGMAMSARAAGADIGENLFGKLATGFAMSIQAAVKGEKEIGEALAAMLETTLYSLGTESTIKAIFETAQAIAAFASQRHGDGALHLASAGIYAAVAALAFGGGAAVSAARGSDPAKSGGGMNPSATQSTANRDSEEDSEPRTINIVFSNPLFANEEDVNRSVRRAFDAAEG